ncbi:hypothetical protein CYFUS_005539 [Cystobacter fuscus]|uniref:Uncharacterized protein n=1 Tax=Cystobacter fuscus TaxID=43 RepID=A0A250J9J3_9BACT|nr:hypothetical protein CYFUS_005539 [Cystobacter fuscus]
MLPSFWPPTFGAIRPYSTAASRGRISPSGPSSFEAPADFRWVLSSHSRLTSRSECLRQGPLAPRALPRFLATTDPSARLSPSPHFASSARAATLLPRAFSAGRGALPCFHPWPCSRAAALYPAGWTPQGRLRGVSAAFAVFEPARHPELTSHEASSGRSLFVAARALAHPAFRGFVGGLHRRALPSRCHPSYAVRPSPASGLSPYGSMDSLQASLKGLVRAPRFLRIV